MTSFVAVLAKTTHVCGCRQVLYYFKVNIKKVHRACDGNNGSMCAPTLLFSTEETPVLKENRQVVLLLWPKTHVHMR